MPLKMFSLREHSTFILVEKCFPQEYSSAECIRTRQLWRCLAVWDTDVRIIDWNVLNSLVLTFSEFYLYKIQINVSLKTKKAFVKYLITKQCLYYSNLSASAWGDSISFCQHASKSGPGWFVNPYLLLILANLNIWLTKQKKICINCS